MDETPSRELDRARLAALTDDALRLEALRVARNEIGRRGSPLASPAFTDCWGECCDRGRPEIFEAAVAEARREREAQAAEQVRRAREMGSKRGKS